METPQSNTPALTPQQWEDKYITEVSAAMTDYNSYMKQVGINMQSGMYTNTRMVANLLDYLKRMDVYLGRYDVTCKWFEDRNLPRFPAYIASSKKSIEDLISAYEQIHAQDQGTDDKIDTMNSQENDHELQMLKAQHDNTWAKMDQFNAKFQDYISRGR